jgi:hypothetical protein
MISIGLENTRPAGPAAGSGNRNAARLRRKEENQRANPHGRIAAPGHENTGREAGSGAGAPPHWFSPEGAAPGIFEIKGKNL